MTAEQKVTSLSMIPLDSKMEYFPDWMIRIKVLLQIHECLEALTKDQPIGDAVEIAEELVI